MNISWIVFTFAVAIAPGNAYKCYQCTTDNSKHCMDIEPAQTKHLEDCPAAAPYCAFTEILDGNYMGRVVRGRYCSTRLKCLGVIERQNCCMCDWDGCNAINTCDAAGTCVGWSLFVVLSIMLVLMKL